MDEPFAAASVAGLRSAPRVWQVGELLQAVASTLALRFAGCSVRGELAAYSRAASGHCYFSLKDADGDAALLRCAMFRRAASLLDFTPRDGQRVELRGRLAVYEPHGELQFVVESMQPAGAGSLYEQFLRLKSRLQAEGLFDAERKRRLPAFPQAIAVVTSLDAAALRDVCSALARRAPHVRVVVYPSAVQGADAPAALASALALASRRGAIDMVLLCRGGGSLEDLWAFNDERVVRAIAACAVPVICGIGHATDVTLADFAADSTAPTPTAAAELAAPATQACIDSLADWQQRLARRLRHGLDAHAQRLDLAAIRLARPPARLHHERQRHALIEQRLHAVWRQSPARARRVLDPLGERLQRTLPSQLEQRRRLLNHLELRLAALNPRRVLARGYAWLSDAQGAPVIAARRLSIGQPVRAVLADGEADATVTGVRIT